MSGGFKVSTTVTDKDMSNIVTTGLEAGSYSSICIVKYVGQPKKAPAWAEYPDIRHTWWWAVGDIKVCDNHDDGEKGVLSRGTLQHGLCVLAEKYPHLHVQLISGNYDVIAADALLQCAAFGDLIYG